MVQVMGDSLQDFVVLKCFDGEEFRVPSALARRSEVVTAGMDAGEYVETGVVPVLGVTGRVLAVVIAYWMNRYYAAVGGVDLGKYDEEYVAGLSHDMRVDVINAAYHLNEHRLFDLFKSPSSLESCT